MFEDVVRASHQLPGKLTLCSLANGWTSLLLRRYIEPAHVEPFETTPIPYQSTVLVKSGATTIESFAAGRWRKANYVPGDLGMVPPGEGARLRWGGRQRHETLQVFLPEALLEQAVADLHDHLGGRRPSLDSLSMREGLVESVVLALEHGVEAGYPAIYADSAAHFLALHLLAFGADRARSHSGGDLQMRRAEEYMRTHLAQPITLSDIAEVIGCSTFQLIRLTKRLRGQTPIRYLGELRMECAERLLRESGMSAVQVSLRCGFTNPSHFATAFRRRFGVSPREFRSQTT
ncbi:AraC family transcriptional regulator [Sphingomonas naphthae]|uniref:AraC family transcriptional regulator n=1 Tax=Sphingomonas naphthae TaxID=1813468 RepID=A0ABY7TNQ3_9SPHN|nr:AraC family transcriptional regulator [Sphingomonas naphthae]WCT74648.1 AraC family transcriptional regulator [Sphingomonas naphthae]